MACKNIKKKKKKKRGGGGGGGGSGSASDVRVLMVDLITQFEVSPQFRPRL